MQLKFDNPLKFNTDRPEDIHPARPDRSYLCRFRVGFRATPHQAHPYHQTAIYSLRQKEKKKKKLIICIIFLLPEDNPVVPFDHCSSDQFHLAMRASRFHA